MKQTNEMNDLEAQLRSWVPRAPSPSLKERLFSKPMVMAAVPQSSAAVEDLTTPSPSFRLNWLAPGFAALLLTFAMFMQRSIPAVSPNLDLSPMIAVAMSNQSAAAYLDGSFSREHNRIPTESFEWTNDSGSTSSIVPLSGWRGKKQ